VLTQIVLVLIIVPVRFAVAAVVVIVDLASAVVQGNLFLYALGILEIQVVASLAMIRIDPSI
jgi:hypothetical protein